MRGIPNILAVSGSTQFRHSMQDCLEAANFDVITCADAIEGLRHLDFSRFDLVVADKAVAADIFEKVRTRQKHDNLPCLLVGDEKPRVGANACVKNPARSQQLVRAVRELLRVRL